MLRRLLGAGVASGGVLGTLLAAGWAGAILMISVVIVIIGALCWILADPERPKRLEGLIKAFRPTRPRARRVPGIAPKTDHDPPAQPSETDPGGLC